MTREAKQVGSMALHDDREPAHRVIRDEVGERVGSIHVDVAGGIALGLNDHRDEHPTASVTSRPMMADAKTPARR